MSAPTQQGTVSPSILVVDGDVVSRHAIAEYLRHCGYAVVEAATTDDALTALGKPALGVDIILCDVGAVGSQSAFGLSTWVRTNRSDLEVRLAGGLQGIVETAADLCENGPHLARPYDPQAVVNYIKQLRASRDRAG